MVNDEPAVRPQGVRPEPGTVAVSAQDQQVRLRRRRQRFPVPPVPRVAVPGWWLGPSRAAPPARAVRPQCVGVCSRSLPPRTGAARAARRTHRGPPPRRHRERRAPARLRACGVRPPRTVDGRGPGPSAIQMTTFTYRLLLAHRKHGVRGGQLASRACSYCCHLPRPRPPGGPARHWICRLAFPELIAVPRADDRAPLTGLCSDLPAARTALAVSAAKDGEIAATAGAADRTDDAGDAALYRGVLRGARRTAPATRGSCIGLGHVSRSRPRCSGWSAGDDAAPAYRLSAGLVLPGVGGLPSFWRPRLAVPIASLDRPIVDLRSGADAAFAPIAGSITVRVVTENAAGHRKRGEPFQQGHEGTACPRTGDIAGGHRLARRRGSGGQATPAFGWSDPATHRWRSSPDRANGQGVQGEVTQCPRECLQSNRFRSAAVVDRWASRDSTTATPPGLVVSQGMWLCPKNKYVDLRKHPVGPQLPAGLARRSRGSPPPAGPPVPPARPPATGSRNSGPSLFP